jgi:enhancer of polycomb-like protein
LGDEGGDDEKEGDDSMDVDEKEDDEGADRLRRLQERWRYDSDDVPPVGPEGPDEQDRVLVDDYSPKYLRHIMPLFQESDLIQLMNDPTIPAVIDGRSVMVMPFRLGMPNPHPQQRMPQNVRQFNPGNLPPNHPLALAAANGTPVSMQHQIKKMQVPTAAPQMRISSNGGMRPPSLPTPAVQTNGITPHHVSPPHPLPVPVPQHSAANGVNGISRAAISMPHVEVQKPEVIATPAIPNGVAAIPSAEPPTDSTVNPVANGVANGVPARPKSQNVTPQSHIALGVPTSGYHLTPMTNMGAVNLMNPTPYQHSAAQQHLPNGLSQQQIANIKTIFNNDSAAVAALQQARSTLPASYMHVVSNGATVMNLPNMNTANLNLKLPAARQMQWMNTPIQRPPSVANGMDAQLNNPLNAALAASPSMGHSVPVRSPSANGSRAGMRNGVHLNGMSPASHMQHSPSPLPNIAQSQSPPRVPMTPNMGMASPALQQQQPVGGTQNGY